MIPTVLIQIFIGVTAIGAVGVYAIWRTRMAHQRRADHMRRTYELSFPATMTHDQVLAFVRSLSGLPGPKFLRPVHALVFETYGDAQGIRNFLHIPGHVNSRVDILLEDHIEGIGLEPLSDADDIIPPIEWHGVELGMRGVDTQLRVEHAKEVSTSIRAGFKVSRPGEAVVMQWVVWPDFPRTVTPDTKLKLSDHTFNVALRMGAVGEHPERLIHDMYAGLHGTHADKARFVRRARPGAADQIRRRAGTLNYSIFLNALELSALMGWPLDGSSKAASRPLAPSPMHDNQGIMLGISNHHKAKGRVIALPIESGDMHVRVMGGSGTGKSNLLLNIGVQWLQRPDTAFVLLEPAGDLAWDMLKRVPAHRVKDTIFFDPTDTDFPVGLNPFAGSDPERITSHIVSVFKNLSGDSWGHQLQRVLTTAVKTTALLGLTLYDTKQLLVNKEYRASQLRRLRRAEHPEILQEWEDFIERKADGTVESSVN